MKSWSSFSQELTEKKANKDYDGDGKIESGSKEHAGVVHNAIQRAKGKKADGQDTRKEEVEIEEGKYSGSKSHIQRDGTAPAPERTAAERKKDRRILAGYGKGGMEMAVDRAKKERDERRKRRAKKEDVEQYVDFLITEGYDCSQLTWEDVTAEYESLDEGLRDAVKKLLGKGKKKEEEKKPESRGEQLRKKYNVGPEKSDTSAKRQILDRTRAKKERDEKEYGGSRYSKSVAKKSADAHDRYLKGGYSKYGADDARGKGNKARKRAEALKKEEVELQELDIKGAVTGALDRGSQFMKKNPVGRAVSNVLKPVGSGRGTARPSVRTQNTIRQNQQSQMNSFEPEGDQIDEGIPMAIGAGAIAAGLAGYKAIKGMQTVNKFKKDAEQGTGLAGRLKKRNQMLSQGTELDGKLVEGIRDEDPEKGTEERKKRLEKKRGHKVDDHPEYAKESATPGQPAEKLKTGRKMFTIPDEERSAAAARLKEKARKKRESSCKKEEVETPVVEEAESKAQQRLMGLALSVKRGDTPMSSVTPQVARMAREMKEKDLKDFAGTKHDGLPEKVKKEEPEVSSPLVESLVESAVQRMVAKARRETAADKRLNRQASSAQQRAELNAKK